MQCNAMTLRVQQPFQVIVDYHAVIRHTPLTPLRLFFYNSRPLLCGRRRV